MGPEIHMENCTGCKECMLACSEKLFGKKDASLAVIQVTKNDGHWEMKICNECGKCAEVCPVEAIHKDSRGILMIDDTVCVGCGTCVEACPSGLMRMAEGMTVPRKCIRCASCVLTCQHNVFQMPQPR